MRNNRNQTVSFLRNSTTRNYRWKSFHYETSRNTHLGWTLVIVTSAQQTSYFIEVWLYFRMYDFNCRWRIRLYFFSSFTMALGQPIRAVNVSRRQSLEARLVVSSTFFNLLLLRPLTTSLNQSLSPFRVTSLCVRCLFRDLEELARRQRKLEWNFCSK